MIHTVEIEWYKQIMPDLDIVFDVGCRSDNIFYRLNPELDIHLFDPTDYGKHKGKYNQIALGEKKGELKYYPEYGSLHKREFKGGKWAHLTHEFLIIQVDTVDNYCEENNIDHIDLLKIDAEGWDYQVLLGAINILQKIKYIQFEDWRGDQVENIKKLLLPYFTIAELGGKPMNYMAVNNTL